MAADQAQTLDNITLFQGLDPAARRALADRCRWQHYAVGQQIVGQLDTSHDVFCIVKGRVRATSYSLAGKEVSYRDIGAGELVGEFSAIDGEPRSATVVALTDSLVAAMSSAVFWQVLERHPSVAAAMLKSLTAQLRSLTNRVFEFSTLAVKNRIHAELLRLAHLNAPAGNTAVIDPAPTHAELASRISTHREAVTRELNALVRGGLIERRGNRWHITDLAKLAHMVELVLGEQS